MENNSENIISTDLDSKKDKNSKFINLSNKSIVLFIFIPILIIAIILTFTLGTSIKSTNTKTSEETALNKNNITLTPTSTAVIKTSPSTIVGLQLDTTKNYGNKYANGVLPVGDNKYTTEAKKGYIYLCHTNFDSQGGGAGTRGPWFINNNTEYDINKKAAIAGSVTWQPSMQISISNGQRILKTNDLPDHKTGVFPVESSDPAHKYDANPNKISIQSLTYTLTENPSYGDPNCVGGETGIMLTGVALFDGFDAGGRDAGAWEVQDGCDGHPQVSGEYHYHTLSKCITDQSVTNILGYALDGFPITGPKVETNNILTTDDLDECHGITSAIKEDGKDVTTYHYVMTQDFPYSVSCFRATPMQIPHDDNIGTDNHQSPQGPR